MTKTLDYFDPAEKYEGRLSDALKNVNLILVISFPVTGDFHRRSMEIVRALLENDKNVVYSEIESELGHDSFLLPIPQYHRILSTYLNKITVKHENNRTKI